jgi:hypothetical protein
MDRDIPIQWICIEIDSLLKIGRSFCFVVDGLLILSRHMTAFFAMSDGEAWAAIPYLPLFS